MLQYRFPFKKLSLEVARHSCIIAQGSTRLLRF